MVRRVLDRLQKLKGHKVIVDYNTSGDVAYAKGILDIDLDSNKIIVESEEKTWFIDPKQVIVLRVDEGDS